MWTTHLQSETSRRNLSPGAMKARSLAPGAPSEATLSLQFPTHTFNLLALMQMLLRVEKQQRSRCVNELLYLSKTGTLSVFLCLCFPVNDDWTKTLLPRPSRSSAKKKKPLCAFLEQNSLEAHQLLHLPLPSLDYATDASCWSVKLINLFTTFD